MNDQINLCRSVGRVMRTACLVALVMTGVLVGGCKQEGGSKPATSQPADASSRDLGRSGGELVILCGSSFVPPCQELMDLFTARTGIKIVMTSAGSEDFLPLVKAGQKGDVLITHDPYLDYVRDAGALEDSVHVGYVAPVLAVRKGNPHQLSGLSDLTRSGLKVALSNPEYSTCGEMLFALLEKKRIKAAVLENVGNRLTKGHPELGNWLKTGAVDAVIMWNGVAHTFEDDIDVVPTPYEYDEEIRVHIIGLNYSGHHEELAKFLEFARSRGQAVFASYGYVK